MRVARKIGEMVVMSLKDSINAARPSQLCPAINPMIDPPRTASYPAGHALQAYLISYCLQRAMPNLPQSAPPGALAANTVASWKAAAHTGLFGLARRIADNRVVAGLHFEFDNIAGFELARRIDSMLGGLAANVQFAQLVADAQSEFPQY